MNFYFCIPVYNEAKTIRQTIESILIQESPSGSQDVKSSRIYVISSGCTDDTEIIVQSLITEGWPISLIKEENRQGKAHAINTFLKSISTERSDALCIFTDGDVKLQPGALTALIREFENHDNIVSVTGCPVPIVYENDIWARIALENCIIWDETRKRLNSNLCVWPLSGYLFAIRAQAIPTEIPNYAIAEDAFIGLYLLKNGHKLGYASHAKVNVRFPATAKDYYLQKSRTRTGWFQIAKIAPTEYWRLKNLQRKIIFSRVKKGNMMSMISWILDTGIWTLDAMFSRHKKDRHLWESPTTTKKLD